MSESAMYASLAAIFKAIIYPLGLACVVLILALFLRGKKHWHNALVWMALGLLWLGGSRYVAVPLAYSLEWRYWPILNVPPVDAVVVLSGGTDGPFYPRPLVIEQDRAGARVLYAYQLYQEGITSHLLISGSEDTEAGTANNPATVQGMVTVLRAMGVPDQAIWQDNTSQNTYQSAVNSAKFLRQEGVHQIVLVTSAIHMPRAVDAFLKQKIDVTPAPTDFDLSINAISDLTKGNVWEQIGAFLPSMDYLDLTTAALKEYWGIFTYHLLGWI